MMNKYSLLALSLVFTLTAAALAPINWNDYNMDANGTSFYNGQACEIKNNVFGWDRLQNPDGSYFTTSKRPIVIVIDSWKSSKVNAYIAQYLLELMGYRTQVVSRFQYIFGPELYSNVVDLEMEIWTGDFTNYAKITQYDRVGVDLGATGYNGVAGMMFPSYLLDQYPEYSLEFWKFLLNPKFRSIFPPSGSGPYVTVDGAPICDNTPGTCVNNTYIPSHCRSKDANCIEMLYWDPGYSNNVYQRLIDGLKLPITINFVGDAAKDIVNEALKQKKPILFYGWTPTVFLATNNFTRILFPSTNATEYVNFTNGES
ncbi:hypothetical protein BCR33DRAFT_744059 [Rhizoclosmatium globosum]|uniref:ABC-type glycine betaine transport system substrate-binding domain-containing protein n=1 Tax=Rhizoclosmatium globosum TaxID=329046 RepID=A0A1Y2BC35_9FUNG|nr:hypothetical protein BCR33DRAFT_744059 [Rhizoclosmatium globosum]|eukprot:ORY32389.1 hypothetical protein BCR33DRAFT_744059 [Rhizoclosmatium globosum]